MKEKAKPKRKSPKRAPAAPVDADSVAGDLLRRAKRAAEKGLEALEGAITTAAAEAKGASGKEGRDARSHLAWLTSQSTGAMGNLARQVDRERKHTGRLSMEQVIAWSRTLDEEQRETLVESIVEIKPAGKGLFGR